jgi:proteasome alpha subunit
MYHVVFDGNVFDRKGFLAMGGQSDELNTRLQRGYDENLALDAALQLAVRVLREAAPAGGEAGNARLEVAVLERDRPRRSFRRLAQEDVASRAGEPAS